MDYTINLPAEILVFLLRYLSGSDRAAVSLTCKRWYDAANHTCFLNKKTIFITKVEPILKIFEESELQYPNYLFKEVEITNNITFWDSVGENIRKLTFKSCGISEKSYLHVLRKCPNLESLKLESCPKLFRSGQLMDDGLEDGPSLNNLKTLSLARNDYISDANFKSFVKAAPNLQELDLTGCTISFNVESNRLFTPSKDKLTFHSILEFIAEKARNLRKLSFSSTAIDDAALKCLSEVENLNLEILQVQSCHQLTDVGILPLTCLQKHLKVLDIGFCSNITDQSLINICHSMTNLEKLNIQGCRAVTDWGIVKLINLKKLRALNISMCKLVTTDNGIRKGICLNVNRTIYDVNVSGLMLDQLCIINMSEKFSEAQKLNLNFCYYGVGDPSIQAVFKNQRWLRSLKLRECSRVTDAGLTGMSKCDLLNQVKENNVVRDDKRKRARMCKDISDITFSLSRLQGLIDLDLSDCNQITDISLKYAFHLKELVSLNLSECCEITHEGMEVMVKNCPSIEILKLVNCYKMTDEGVVAITKSLHRLKMLNLRGCEKLTDKSLESIRTHCKRLAYLNVENCRNLSPQLADNLKKHIKALRTVGSLLESEVRSDLGFLSEQGFFEEINFSYLIQYNN